MSRDDQQLHWFHGKLTRERAEELIKTEGQTDGTFLVRESNTAAGDFVLTLLHQGEVLHYQIRRHGEDAFFSVDDKVKVLHGLDTLIDFYRNGNNGLVTQLTGFVKKDAPPNNVRSHGVTRLLHRAIINNNQTVVSAMLACAQDNLDAKNEDGQTPVHLAALHCEEPILQLLLTAGAGVNSTNTSGYTPLHYACRDKSAAFVRMLIAAHANVQARHHQNGHVPMHEAATHGNLAAIVELLAAQAALLPRTSDGFFPIELAEQAQRTQVVEFLRNYKVPAANTYQAQWQHGTLSRDEAAAILLKHAADLQQKHAECDGSGCFLVRYSERNHAPAISLLWNQQVKHFIISKHLDKATGQTYLYIDDGPYLTTLEHLVEHFMRFSDGMPVTLKYAVAPKPKPPLPLFTTMPRAKTPKKTLISPSSESLHKLPKDEHLRKINMQALTQTLQHTKHKKQKEKERKTSAMFNTLTFPKLIMPKPKTDKAKVNNTTNEQQAAATTANHSVEPALKHIFFKTEFGNLSLSEEQQLEQQQQQQSPISFYNVPQNNSAVDATNPIAIEIAAKTEAELEYFTKRDVDIERERAQADLEQLQVSLPPRYTPEANGYINTVDVRVFLERSKSIESTSKEAIEASAAQLREFAQHPERLESMISTTSTEIVDALQRQLSNGSTNTLTAETASQIRLNYLIPRDCLQLGDKIGEGEFSWVHKGRLFARTIDGANEELSCEVAIKTLRDEHCRANKQELLREASVMIGLQHHCIVQLIGICKGEKLMMVQELLPLGSMLSYILKHKEQINPHYELKLWASQIACGMMYLEAQHYVHRDLAARNILLASRNQAKISDFGLSRAFGLEDECYQAMRGGKWPIKWYAPESYQKGIFSHASDVWSFGITLWEMFSLGEPPYGDKMGVDVIKQIENNERLPAPKQCPPHVYEIMRNCWNYEPKDRPTFRYLTEFFARDPDYENIMELVKTSCIN